ncbi:MAG: aldo/keto reductase [Thermoplasmata archaeon]
MSGPRARTRPARPAHHRPSRSAPAPIDLPEGLPMRGTDRRHPSLGLGLWALGRWSAPDEARTRDVLAHALARGIPWLDTAEVYGAGRSERLLGDALARAPEGAARPFVTTKLSWEHLRAAQVRAALLGSRRRLGLSRIDLYLVHAPDPHVPVEETFGALRAAREEGLFDALGVSNFSLEQLRAAEAAAGPGGIQAVQVRFNLFEREEADPILPFCRERGIVVEAYTPLARGLLAGRFLSGRPAPGDPGRGRGLFQADRLPSVRARARRLRDLAAASGVPMLSLALHGIARDGAVPLFGASRPEQVDEVLSAWSIRPDREVLERAVEIARDDAD